MAGFSTARFQGPAEPASVNALPVAITAPAPSSTSCGSSARRSPASSAVSWLAASREGHCGTTSGPGDCAAGDKGSWPLSQLGLPRQTWSHAIAACLERCSQCARCTHVSVSLAYDDCSWFASSCNHLEQVPASFRSGSLARWHRSQCTATLAPVRQTRSASEWLRRSIQGLCGATDDAATQSCESDDAGAWSFKALGVRASEPNAWDQAARACVQRCSVCARCRNISISLLNEECSWYASCESERIVSVPNGYRSAGIDGSDRSAGLMDLRPKNGISAATASSELDRAVARLSSLRAREARADLPGASHVRPLLLLGIFSGSTARRAALRCTWAAKLSARSEGTVRLLFVVGAATGEPLGDLREQGGDELRVPVLEGQKAHRADAHSQTKRGVAHGTITKQLKVIAFLKWTAMQHVPLIGLADDDVFVSVPMLVAVARLLDERMRQAAEWQHLYVGSMEWFSWHNRTLVSSGHAAGYPLASERRDLPQGLGLPHALRLAQEPWRNCSPNGNGWSWTGWAYREADALPDTRGDRDFCHGPLAFARGPLTLLSLPAVQWLVASSQFKRDAATSDAMARDTYRTEATEDPRLLLEPGSRAVLEDVLIGYWLASHPTLKMVQLPQEMWAGGLKLIGGLGRLLVAHQVPWKFLPWLTAEVDSLWTKSGARMSSRCGCFGPICASGHCAHHESQRACGLQIEVLSQGGGTGASCRLCACKSKRRDGSVSHKGRRGKCGNWDWSQRRQQRELDGTCSSPVQ